MNSPAEPVGSLSTLRHGSWWPNSRTHSRLLLLGKVPSAAAGGSSSMQSSSSSALAGGSPRSLAEESLQMWDLNKRLEAYLARVKFLEEENELLRTEVQQLKGCPGNGGGGCGEASWRGQCEEEVAALRAHLDEAFREKHLAQLARDSLCAQVQLVRGRCQKEQAAQEEARRLLSGSKKELEEEKRAHIWLRERAAQLQKELQGLLAGHAEEKARLEDQERAGCSWRLGSFPATAAFQPPAEVEEDYAKRLASLWQGAVETYKAEVQQLEASLSQAKGNLCKATQGHRQSQLQLQQLKKELAGLRMRKERLEETLSRQWQQQQGDAQKLQLAVEALEEEKQRLGAQIRQVLEEQQQLMHLKMSLSLEVATYRTLLEAESTRLQVPTTTDHRLASGLWDAKLEASQGRLRGAAASASSLDGPRDLGPRPSLRPGGAKGQRESAAAASLASGLSQGSRSPVARAFENAKPALQSPPSMNGFDVALPDEEEEEEAVALAFVDVASRVEAASQSCFHESPLTPVSPGAASTAEEPCSRPEGGLQEEGGEMASPVGGEEEELHEEGEPSEESPGQAAPPSVPYPLTEASEVNGEEDPSLGLAGFLNRPEAAPNGGIPPPSPPLEEGGKGAAPSSTSRGLREEAAPPLQKEQEAEKVPEAAAEVNGGGGGGGQERQEGGAEGWPPSQAAELAWPQDTEGFLGEDRESKEDSVGEAPGRGETGGSSEEDADAEQQSGRQASDAEEEASACAGPAAGLLGPEESWAPGTSQPPPEDLEESEGGPADLEVLSTEALHLSEDEERRELWSPSSSRDKEASSDCQAETPAAAASEGLEPWLLLLPPLRSPACSADPPFLGAEEQEATGPASPEEDRGAEGAGEPQAWRVEEEAAILGDDDDGTPARAEGRRRSLRGAGKPRTPEGVAGAEEGPGGEDVLLGHRGAPCRGDENALDGEEDTVSQEGVSGKEEEEAAAAAAEGYARLLPGARKTDGVSQLEEGGVKKRETSRGERKEDPGGEASEGRQLPPEQKATEEEDGEVLSEEEEWALDAEATQAGSGEQAGDQTDRSGSARSWQDQQSSPRPAAAQPEVGTQAGHAEEQQSAAETEDGATVRSQTPRPLAQSTVCETAATKVASEGVAADEQRDEGHSCPQAPTGAFPGSESHPLQRSNDSGGSEESLEPADPSPNASCEADGIEHDLASGRRVIVLEDTLPDHTPLHLYDGGGLGAAVAGEQQWPAESEGAADLPPLSTKDGSAFLEDKQRAVEEQDPCGPQAEESGQGHTAAMGAVDDVSRGAGQKGGCCGDAPALKQASPKAVVAAEEEPPTPRDSKEETPELSQDRGEGLHQSEAEAPREEEASARLEAEGHQQPGGLPEQPPEEVAGMDWAGEPEEDGASQAGEPGGHREAEGAPKVSPLTSVADLGEIVLDGELPPEVHGAPGEAESQEEEGLPPVCGPQEISDPESWGGEGATQLRDLVAEEEEEEPSGEAGPDPPPEATAVSISEDGMKDSDILEIVEQALEFNQELIKAAAAAEQSTGAEQPAPEGSAQHSPGEGGAEGPSASVEESQPFPDPPQTSSPRPKDAPAVAPTQSWTERNADRLQPDPQPAELPATEVPNGIGGLLLPGRVAAMDDDGTASREEPVKGLATAQQVLEEGVAGLSRLGTLAPSPPARDEALRPGEGNSESRRGLEALGADELQTAGLKGKKAPVISISTSPRDGDDDDDDDDILSRESDQRLTFRAEEGQEERWVSEGN